MNPAYRDVIIVGCGFTGQRVLQALHREAVPGQGLRRSHGFDVNRQDHLDSLARMVSAQTAVLLSVPTQRTQSGALFECTPKVMNAVAHALRVVYLSTTGVYGAQPIVDEKTPIAPRNERELLRAQAEASVLQHPNAMVLRPAAIYGPGRGAHIAMQQGRFSLANGEDTFTSRIHVDDLASLALEGLLRSDLVGAWPVADQEPSTARAIAEFCSKLLNIPMPPETDRSQLPETRQGNRRVDGRAVREKLKITLSYPSYRVGIPACIAEEQIMHASLETGDPR